ncbi:hypothetical protein [Leisingera sp. ANG-Vp]|uniref:hypothetical protein n=1 Tax=Leisingera sp. ANG-Vp TaxID=1577896 RepID=UPI00057C9324|nr:hypothetical protein [Leisingera sp. ANG-Vp]KIC20652.1 hypothetical protein RA20_08505 [Leisingera sp. ANG-Vp]
MFEPPLNLSSSPVQTGIGQCFKAIKVKPNAMFGTGSLSAVIESKQTNKPRARYRVMPETNLLDSSMP